MSTSTASDKNKKTTASVTNSVKRKLVSKADNACKSNNKPLKNKVDNDEMPKKQTNSVNDCSDIDNENSKRKQAKKVTIDSGDEDDNNIEDDNLEPPEINMLSSTHSTNSQSSSTISHQPPKTKKFVLIDSDSDD